MNRVLCVGEALIDMICTDKGTALSDGINFMKKAGGAPANVAAAVAALGGQVDMAARVGNDPFGKHLISLMDEMGVGTRFMVKDNVHFTTLAFVSLMVDGERDFYFNRGADGYLAESDLQDIRWEDYSIIHFGSATAFLPGTLQQTYFGLLDKALEKGIFISFDPNYRHLLFAHQQDIFRTHAWAFMRAAHFYKLSDEEALLITETEQLDDAIEVLLEKTDAVFAITLGAAGTLLRVGGHTVVVPSIPVNPVDTTGAGDAFVGALLYQLQVQPRTGNRGIEMHEWKRMVMHANKAGARTCMFMGAMEAFRHLNHQIFE